MIQLIIGATIIYFLYYLLTNLYAYKFVNKKVSIKNYNVTNTIKTKQLFNNCKYDIIENRPKLEFASHNQEAEYCEYEKKFIQEFFDKEYNKYFSNFWIIDVFFFKYFRV